MAKSYSYTISSTVPRVLNFFSFFNLFYFKGDWVAALRSDYRRREHGQSGATCRCWPHAPKDVPSSCSHDKESKAQWKAIAARLRGQARFCNLPIRKQTIDAKTQTEGGCWRTSSFDSWVARACRYGIHRALTNSNLLFFLWVEVQNCIDEFYIYFDMKKSQPCIKN